MRTLGAAAPGDRALRRSLLRTALAGRKLVGVNERSRTQAAFTTYHQPGPDELQAELSVGNLYSFVSCE